MEYGGMAVSRLTVSHVQKEIKTRMVTAENRTKLFEAIKRNVQHGHQALIIYPLAETKDAENIDKKSAEGAFKLWSKLSRKGSLSAREIKGKREAFCTGGHAGRRGRYTHRNSGRRDRH